MRFIVGLIALALLPLAIVGFVAEIAWSALVIGWSASEAFSDRALAESEARPAPAAQGAQGEQA